MRTRTLQTPVENYQLGIVLSISFYQCYQAVDCRRNHTFQLGLQSNNQRVILQLVQRRWPLSPCVRLHVV